MRYKIVQVMATQGGVVGGLEKHTLQLCAALAEKHEVHLLADKPYASVCPKGVVFHTVDFSQSRWNPRLYWQLGQYLNDIQPHIVHAQAGKAASLLRWLKWLFRHMLFVATVHGTKKDISAYADMDGVIAVSNMLAAPFPADKVRVIYNGSQLPPLLNDNEKKALRQRLVPEDNKPLLIAVGRLAPVKAYDILLRAFVGVDAHLLIVGDGPERENLEHLAQELLVLNQVTFLGQRQDVSQLLQVADLCVISSHREGFPLIMVESLQVGCPVISTEVSGVKEWLPPALMTEPNNVQALHDLLCVTLQRLPLLRRNYLPIFLRAKQELTVEGMTQRTLDFYHDLLEARQQIPS
ncbi:glycosyltransferase [Agitococcus lubricus]|uniref:Glycosyltransferase involved in cell wall biosynthesis n=1 Tax=Agitococcus lubricus TaxID=1077255 RepID=A0A2T5J153_9GAMM|nr:glycosyltransferase [Agitococcus lubricus]PTQ90029.1 glycosyltransferase involved in cell wall biosynthesis [Agitococcus lubricus]